MAVGRRGGKRRSLPSARRLVQALTLGLFVASVAMAGRGPGWLPADLFSRLDPLLSLEASIAARSIVSGLWVGLALLVATLLLGRFFCGWACPMGTCLDLGDRLLFKSRQRAIVNQGRRLRGLKYGVLALVLGAALLGHGLAWLFDPITWMNRVIGLALAPLGVGVVAALLDVGAPLLDAMGMPGLARAHVVAPGFGLAGFLAVLFLAAVISLGYWQRRFWCRSICPLGALLALPARFALVRRSVDRALCDGEGACRRLCETGAIGADPTTTDAAECVACQACVPACPPGATSFAAAAPGGSPPVDLSRRRAMAALGTGTIAGVWLASDPVHALRSAEAIRPPGARLEEDFLARCVRCHLCVAACPTGCLVPALGEGGLAGLMAPVPLMRVGPCSPECVACGQVCPTGAIRLLAAEEKPYARIGNAVIDRALCIAWERDHPCLVCEEACPWGAIQWEEGPTGTRRPSVEEVRCNGCGHCEHACPVEGVSAIRVGPTGQVRLSTGSWAQAARERGLVAKEKEPAGYW